jgi:hypothetical protein
MAVRPCCYFFRGISLETLMESAFVDGFVVFLAPALRFSPVFCPVIQTVKNKIGAMSLDPGRPARRVQRFDAGRLQPLSASNRSSSTPRESRLHTEDGTAEWHRPEFHARRLSGSAAGRGWHTGENCARSRSLRCHAPRFCNDLRCKARNRIRL